MDYIVPWPRDPQISPKLWFLQIAERIPENFIEKRINFFVNAFQSLDLAQSFNCPRAFLTVSGSVDQIEITALYTWPDAGEATVHTMDT